MKKNHNLSGLSLALLAAFAVNLAQAQTDGEWSQLGSGAYSTTSNWLNGTVAGSGGAANFNNVNIPAGAATVTLDAAVSLNSLTFGDTDTATAGTWTIGGTNTLTLSGTTPTITANRDVTLATTITLAGTSGFTKAGSGTLTVNNNVTSLTGNIALTGGTLALGKNGSTGGGTVGAGTITMSNGTTFRMTSTSNALNFPTNPISLVSGASATLSSANAGNGYGGLVTGDASSVLNIVGTVALGNTGTANAQFANFNGEVNVASGNSIRFSSTSGANGNGGANTTFTVNGSIFTRNAGGANGVVLGALTGSGSLNGQTNITAGDVAYVIGGKNIDATFSGTIVQGSQGSASIRKVGTGTQSFTGSMTSAGTISVTAGTAFFGGGFNKSGAGAITVSGGTLGGSNATLTGAATVSSGGTLRPNAAPSNATDRLTFATSLSLAGNTTFDLDGSKYTGVTSTGATAFNGALAINLVNTLSDGTYSYNLFDFGSQSGAFTSVSITSLGSLTRDVALNGLGTWSGAFGSNTFQFTESDGILGITVSSIPEPSTWAALAGLAGLAFAAGRRRRRAA